MSDETWEAKGPDAFGDFIIASKGEELAKCVVVQNGFRTPEETAAIAARLIKAVNNHGALVNALRQIEATSSTWAASIARDALRAMEYPDDPVGGMPK